LSLFFLVIFLGEVQACPYPETGWPAAHKNGQNSGSVEFSLAKRYQIAWRRLEDRGVFHGVTVSADGLVYVTSGKGQGYSSLAVFDTAGQLAWESSPYRTQADLDSRAIYNVATLDCDGHAYLTDSNQVWAFSGKDGAVRWVKPLPLGATATLSVQFIGDALVGVTGDGQVFARRRSDGKNLARTFRIPSTPPAKTWRFLPVDTIPGQAVIDRSIYKEVFGVFIGRAWPVSNTPAVHPTLARLYIPVNQRQGAALFAIDFDPEMGFSIKFATPLQGSTATSPVVAPSGGSVYLADSSTILAAFDAYTGVRQWSADLGARMVGAPTIDHDGATVYATVQDQGIYALEAVSGKILWQQRFAFLDARAGTVADSTVLASKNYLYVVVRNPDEQAYLVGLSKQTGAPANTPLLLPYPSEAPLTAGPDRAIYVTHLGWGSNSPMGGGVTALQPVD
jgi:outer membrane protein assembly factor BamB